MLHLDAAMGRARSANRRATAPGHRRASCRRVTNTPRCVLGAAKTWAALSKDTGVGDPRAGTAEEGGRRFSRMIVTAIVPVLTQLSAAKLGDFPFVYSSK